MKKMENFEKSLKQIEKLEKFIKLVKENIRITLDTNEQYEELADRVSYMKDSEEFELTKEEAILLTKFMTAE